MLLILSTLNESEAQTAIVRRNANLRPSPSTNQAPIRLLTPPEELRVLNLTPVNGYYNVATEQNEQGWVYGNFIQIDEARLVGKVKRNTNLRPNPSSAQSPIRLLTPPEEVTLLSPNATNNYYHVRTNQNEEGWAYRPNVEIVTVQPEPPQPEPTPFPDARDAPIAGWDGPVFKLSQNYPTSPPPPETQPWKAFNFRTQPEQYLASVLAYVLEGNREVEWRVDQNSIRKWYHVPWLHSGPNGREFVRGLTRERSSRPGELHPQQTSTFRNYAVGIYNPPGGHIVGRVWQNHENPNPGAAQFPDGTVTAKLLFTSATVNQVPYLANALEWDAHVSSVGTDVRSIQKLRLLQIDVAVRDSRANSTTGWVFGTFAYDGTAPGSTPWDRMKPVGLMWGNDPGLTPSSGRTPTESIILNRTIGGATLRLGWAGRLNGPVDNPASACLACHGTAQHQYVAGVVPSGSDTARLRWFRNLAPGTPFDAGQTSLDYSLQLAVSIRNFFESRQPPDR
jgi:hypothetical protein